MTMALYLISKRLFGERAYQSLTRGPVAGSEKPLGRTGTVLAAAFILAVVALACMPHLSVMLMAVSERWFDSIAPQSYTLNHLKLALSDDLAVTSIRNSVLYSS